MLEDLPFAVPLGLGVVHLEPADRRGRPAAAISPVALPSRVAAVHVQRVLRLSGDIGFVLLLLSHLRRRRSNVLFWVYRVWGT